MNYLMLICIGLLGWWLLKTLKAPAAGLIGPMFFVGITNMLGFNFPELPKLSVTIFQIILGIFVGMKIKREEFKVLKNRNILYAGILVLAWTVSSSLLAANTLMTFTHLDVATALLGGTPGGLSEMSVAAFSYGANVPTVALLQLLRLTFIVLTIPFLALTIKEKNGCIHGQKCDETVEKEKEKKSINPEIIASGVLLGTLFIYLEIPAGGLIGSIIGVGISSVMLKKSAYLPKHIHLVAQIGIGISVGLKFTEETLHQLRQLIGPMIILPFFMVISGIILAFIIKSITKWDISTCLLCSAPAGLSQMIIVAEDIDCDIFMVSFFQTTRLLTIYLILPQVFTWYLK
ncbi:hypothetical protein SAMN05446037_104424 [Anaerovirgula multivorans]|uniref:Membrane protein AbrB duplication n=1 Tax=Anaerovirgula multivorans TaxID=312168 RepID=A0A239K9I5_9FIRM|nr:AbrB family transcriptional regulator [Anaerovirgula multivorans]SNT14303.1 hypothetical protein SAMN05446037_104424 [Anaerovirgula multivorans]